MRKLVTAAIALVALALCLIPTTTSHTAAQANPTATAVPTPAPTGPPVQGAKRNILMYVDTVQGGAGNPKPAVGCSQTNLFKRGQQVVFRMWGVNVKLGGVALLPSNVASAQITVPGLSAPLTLNYGTHPSGTSFWSSAWIVPADYPMGVVDFTVIVKTKAKVLKVNGQKKTIKPFTSKFTQQGLATTSRLTVTP